MSIASNLKIASLFSEQRTLDYKKVLVYNQWTHANGLFSLYILLIPTKKKTQTRRLVIMSRSFKFIKKKCALKLWKYFKGTIVLNSKGGGVAKKVWTLMSLFRSIIKCHLVEFIEQSLLQSLHLTFFFNCSPPACFHFILKPALLGIILQCRLVRATLAQPLAHCTLHTEHCTLRCAMYTVYYTLHTAHCSPKTAP